MLYACWDSRPTISRRFPTRCPHSVRLGGSDHTLVLGHGTAGRTNRQPGRGRRPASRTPGNVIVEGCRWVRWAGCWSCCCPPSTRVAVAGPRWPRAPSPSRVCAGVWTGEHPATYTYHIQHGRGLLARGLLARTRHSPASDRSAPSCLRSIRGWGDVEVSVCLSVLPFGIGIGPTLCVGGLCWWGASSCLRH